MSVSQDIFFHHGKPSWVDENPWSGNFLPATAQSVNLLFLPNCQVVDFKDFKDILKVNNALTSCRRWFWNNADKERQKRKSRWQKSLVLVIPKEQFDLHTLGSAWSYVEAGLCHLQPLQASSEDVQQTAGYTGLKPRRSPGIISRLWLKQWMLISRENSIMRSKETSEEEQHLNDG